MKKKAIFLTIFLIIIIYSCDQEVFVFDVNCDECTILKPDSADLIVHVTINEDNPYVPLVFYKGVIDDSIVDWVDTTRDETLYLYSEIDEFYSVEAKYKNGDKTIIAIDGDKLKASRVSDVCDADCWIVKGGILDVRLK